MDSVTSIPASASASADPARRLLSGAGVLADQLRWGLTGLRAGLAAALAEHPEDPGAGAVRQLLEDWGSLLDGTSDSGPLPAPAEGPEGTAVRPAPEAAQALLDAATGIAARSGVPAGWLSGMDRSAGVPLLWLRMHLLALRLPAVRAGAWRAALAAATGGGTEGPWRDLPGDTDLVVVPPIAGQPGLRLGPGAPLAADVASSLGLDPAPNDGPAGRDRLLGAVATSVLGIMELDESLRVGLHTVHHRGLGAVDHNSRSAYRRSLLARLAALASTEPGSPAAFRALLDVDEALNSVLHRPVAAAGSAWADLGERSRAVVYAAQRDHPDVGVQLLAGPYRAAVHRTGADDIGVQSDGSGCDPGDVVACLRLWARVAGVEIKGRVVYCG